MGIVHITSITTQLCNKRLSSERAYIFWITILSSKLEKWSTKIRTIRCNKSYIKQVQIDDMKRLPIKSFNAFPAIRYALKPLYLVQKEPQKNVFRCIAQVSVCNVFSALCFLEIIVSSIGIHRISLSISWF